MHSHEFSRRQLLQKSVIATGAAVAAGASTRRSLAASSKIELQKGNVILFQGDSITDARRDRKSEPHANHPRALGTGYPFLIAGDLLQAHPKFDLKIYNRGISGHKVPDLQKRWQKDTLDLKPAVLSVLVGVNDIWHKFAGRYDGTVEDYRTGFTALLNQTKKALPETTIVVCEPFALRCGAVKNEWFPEFDERRAVAREVAETTGSIWVPFQTMFDEAIATGTDPSYWAADGVHPTLAGHTLMAKTWREVVGI